LADEPEGRDDDPVESAEGRLAAADEAEVAALAELALCENLAQTSGWAARWSATMAGADATLLWAPDTVHPIFLCIGAEGKGVEKLLRRSAPRETGYVHELVRDRRPIVLTGDELDSDDPFVRGVEGHRACLAVPLQAEGLIVGLLAIYFTEIPDAEEALSRLEHFLDQAAPALGRALRAERKTVGMLHAIERLTNLYDLSKAFGSTIDVGELSTLVARKAADIVTAESACLWLFEGDDVVAAAMAVNENYDVESPPNAVGGSVVGDVIADQASLRRNRVPASDPVATENPLYPVRSILAVPLVEDEIAIGALVVANKRGRHPEFSPEDEELLADVSRQAVRAMRIARQHEAEKKVEELDALLAVSREITATLDLGKVMTAIVNGAAALIPYDRCAIAIQDRGRLRLGAVSGKTEIDRKDPSIARTDQLLQWVFLTGADVDVTQFEDGSLAAGTGENRPETEEKFRAFFAESGMRAYYGTTLRDEEGKLGAISFECREPIVFEEGLRDLLGILVNQATVSLRNAQLYQQVPLAGFLKPLVEKRRRLEQIPKRKRIRWAAGLAAALLVLFVVPWRFRVGGPAVVQPARRAVVTAPVDGIVASVLRREGDRLAPGAVIARLEDRPYRASLAEARAAYENAERDLARAREAGDAGAVFEARSRSNEQAARIAVEEQRLRWTQLASPVAGVIVTPRLEERVGQVLARGDEFCVVADAAGSVTVEVAVPEADAAALKPGQPSFIKLNPFPTRTFRGEVARVGARVRQEGEERFVIAEVKLPNEQGLLRTGMLGRGKVRIGYRSIAYLLLRKPARWIYGKLWPLLP
jgi:GAF domain-containing protein/multidrug resistance efflux pump